MSATDVPLPSAIARVHAPVAPMLAEPRVSSGQVSQALHGHLLSVSERRDDWCRVHSLDGYAGWTHRGYLHVVDVTVDEPEQATPVPSEDVHEVVLGVTFASDADARLVHVDDETLRISLGCTVRDDAGRVRRLPLGAWLGDRDAILLDGDAVPAAEREVRFPADGEAIVRTAVRYFEGTSYQWGGATPWGADCSGLVQTVFALHGVALPRDAYQQAELGADAGTDALALRAGDLLFFSDRDDRRITHVGIATGDGRMAHLALGRGGWALDRLDDTGDPYVATLMGRFLFARRVS
jgi:hypothetical protein